MKLPIETPCLEQFSTEHAAVCETEGFCACQHCLLPLLGCLASDIADHINNDKAQPNTHPIDLLLGAAARLFAEMKLTPEELLGAQPELVFMKKCSEALAYAEKQMKVNTDSEASSDASPTVH